MKGCLQYGRKRKLLVGYLLGITCFFIFDAYLDDGLSDALSDAALWLPIDLVYGTLIFLVSSRIPIMQVSPVLEVNGFLIGVCPLLEVWPPYMEPLGYACTILRDHLIAFVVLNVVIISVATAFKKTVK